MASHGDPTYTAKIVAGQTTYDITPILMNIDVSDQENQMAQRFTITIMNIMIDGQWSTNVFEARQRVFVYADDGEKQDEVFRGWLWKKNYVSSNEKRDFQLICYDNLIYFQESEVYYYFSAGKSTEDILKAICDQWGVKLEYNYESITHEKLLLKGTLSNIITNDILDLVRDRTGKKYVIRMIKDTMHIDAVGENTTIYQFNSQQNVVETTTEQTMEGMITRVVIFGKQGENERAPVEAIVEEHVEEYGTLQKVVGRTESSTLEDAKKEADTIVNMNKWPFWNYELQAPDIPWLRKGDVVYINAGGIYDKYLIIKNISRSISQKGATINLSLDDGKPREYQTTYLTGSISSESTTETTDGSTGSVTDGNVSASQQSVINAAYSTPSAGYNLCATWVTWVFNKVGIHFGGNGCDMTANYCHSNNLNDLKPGMIIGVVHSPWSYQYGHIAVYVGNDTILSCELGAVATYSVSKFINTYGPSNGGSTVMWGWGGGVSLA